MRPYLTRRRFLGTILFGLGSTAFSATACPFFPLRVPKMITAGFGKGGVPETDDLIPAPGNLTAEDWRNLRALVDSIIPETTKSVSASNAGVLRYIDRALSGPYAHSLTSYRKLVTLLNGGTQASRLPFWKLGPTEVIHEATRFEKDHPDSFAMIRKHTLEGYFSAPRHGGNIGCRGWKVVTLRSHILPWRDVQGQ